VKKEVLWAIIFGLLVALGITFIVYRQQNQIVLTVASPTPTTLTELPTKLDEPLTITSPENESVFEEKAITITGSTSPNLPIVIFVNQKDFFTQSDADGNFSLNVNLESGSNQIMATTVDDYGVSYSDQVLVIYTNKSLEETLVSDEEIKSN